MEIADAYNHWSKHYDSDVNRTRDLEGVMLRKALASIPFESCLEIGCGTGKNTEWLVQKASHVTAVDISPEMLAVARKKVSSPHATFKEADILNDWSFGDRKYDIVTFSLVLEHIDLLKPVFARAAMALAPGGYVYAGELHPFKQYTGTKARFNTDTGLNVVPCFNHHVSDFLSAARACGLNLVLLDEVFDADDPKGIPRIITFLWNG